MSLPNKNSYNSLGGELADYSPSVDPTTDLSAEANNEARADTAAMTRTAVRAWCKFTVNAGVCSVSNLDYEAVYGTAIDYKPTVAYDGAGLYTVTFPEKIIDARGITQTLDLQICWGNIELVGSGFTVVINVKPLSPNTVKVFCNVSGPAGDPLSTSDKICVFVM